jgi:hypothetical protein
MKTQEFDSKVNFYIIKTKEKLNNSHISLECNFEKTVYTISYRKSQSYQTFHQFMRIFA